MNVVVLALANQRYAVPVAHVREIVRAVAVAPLPGAPDVVEGIVNLRGRLVPVMDTRRRFGVPLRPTELSDFLVIADAGTRDVALHVDQVIGVHQIGEDQVVPAEQLVQRSAFIGGLAALADGTLLIHDPSEFLQESESAALEAALAAGTAA